MLISYGTVSLHQFAFLMKHFIWHYPYPRKNITGESSSLLSEVSPMLALWWIPYGNAVSWPLPCSYFSPLLQEHTVARQFKNFNTFNKTLALLNQCPFHRSDIQGVRGKANTGSIQINLLMWKGHCQTNSSSLKLPEGNRKTDWCALDQLL